MKRLLCVAVFVGLVDASYVYAQQMLLLGVGGPAAVGGGACSVLLLENGTDALQLEASTDRVCLES